MDFGLILPRMSAYDADTLGSLVAEQREGRIGSYSQWCTSSRCAPSGACVAGSLEQSEPLKERVIGPDRRLPLPPSVSAMPKMIELGSGHDLTDSKLSWATCIGPVRAELFFEHSYCVLQLHIFGSQLIDGFQPIA